MIILYLYFIIFFRGNLNYLFPTTFSWSYKRRGLVLAHNKHIQCLFYKLVLFQISLLNNNDKRTEKPRNYLLPKTKRFFGWSAVCRKCVQAWTTFLVLLFPSFQPVRFIGEKFIWIRALMKLKSWNMKFRLTITLFGTR